ncbi:MAG: fibronectin type III domain-containing protein [Micrococcales bacterium]|nr:fibronectin type III domain-containing protein [Micrococcales bacterium]
MLAWNAPDARGAAITGYRVTASPGGKQVACPSTTCTVDGLTNGTSYTFTVAAQNAVGWSPESPSSASAAPDAVPDTPAAPTVVGGDKSVDVSWSAPANNGSPIKSYELRISPPPEDPRYPSTIRATTTRAQFDGLTNGLSYTVQVRAYNDASDPSLWSEWSGPAVPAGVPNAPGGLAVAPANAGQLQLTWQAPSNNGAPLESYQLTVDSAGGASRSFAPAANATSYTVDAENGVQYTFTLRASNAVGLSASATVQGSTFGVPEAPQVTSVVGQVGGAYGNGTAQVVLSPRGDGGSPITYYNLRDSNERLSTTTSTETTISGLMGGQAVSVQAQACNSRGCGIWSGRTSASPQPQTRPGSVNLSLDVTSDAAGQPVQAQASWSIPAQDAVFWAGGSDRQYRVRWSVDGQTVSETTTTTRNAQLTQGLPVLSEGRPSANITVTVTATTSVGAGEPEQRDWTVSWVAGPAAPANLRVVITDGNVFTGTWNRVDGAVRYEWTVYRTDGEVTRSGSTTDMSGSATVEHGANNRVIFQVRAVGADGRTSSWTSVQAYPQ